MCVRAQEVYSYIYSSVRTDNTERRTNRYTGGPPFPSTVPKIQVPSLTSRECPTQPPNCTLHPRRRPLVLAVFFSPSSPPPSAWITPLICAYSWLPTPSRGANPIYTLAVAALRTLNQGQIAGNSSGGRLRVSGDSGLNVDLNHYWKADTITTAANSSCCFYLKYQQEVVFHTPHPTTTSGLSTVVKHVYINIVTLLFIINLHLPSYNFDLNFNILWREKLRKFISSGESDFLHRSTPPRLPPRRKIVYGYLSAIVLRFLLTKSHPCIASSLPFLQSFATLVYPLMTRLVASNQTAVFQTAY